MARIGLRLYPSEQEAHSLAKYVAFRKREILEEMDLVYMRRMEPCRVDYLSF
jgi:hypothetical protein